MRSTVRGALLISMLVLSASAANARVSYLFGASPRDGLGSAPVNMSPRFSTTLRKLAEADFQPLVQTYGSLNPSDLRMTIKDDEVYSRVTQAFVATLSFQKANLMQLYHLSNQDYNRLAALAFGILGKETKFGTSFKYRWKEDHQGPMNIDLPVGVPGLPIPKINVHLGSLPSPIYLSKIAKMKERELDAAISSGDIQKLLNIENLTVAANSRGLTQIKNIPDAIEKFYCVDEDQLTDGRVAAVATLGFLADSLKITRSFARVRHLNYIDSENIYDYVLYVYFGSSRQLVNPKFGYKQVLVSPDQTNFSFYAGRIYEGARACIAGDKARSAYQTVWTQLNETATPDKNVYIQSVKHYIRSLAMFENERKPFPIARDNGCLSALDDPN